MMILFKSAGVSMKVGCSISHFSSMEEEKFKVDTFYYTETFSDRFTLEFERTSKLNVLQWEHF